MQNLKALLKRLLENKVDFVLIGGFACLASTYFQSDFMKVIEAEKKWGLLTLDTQQFKSGDLSKRAPMAIDIVKRSLYVGKGRKTAREELGDPDSYFFSDTIYA